MSFFMYLEFDFSGISGEADTTIERFCHPANGRVNMKRVFEGESSETLLALKRFGPRVKTLMPLQIGLV